MPEQREDHPTTTLHETVHMGYFRSEESQLYTQVSWVQKKSLKYNLRTHVVSWKEDIKISTLFSYVTNLANLTHYRFKSVRKHRNSCV